MGGHAPQRGDSSEGRRRDAIVPHELVVLVDLSGREGKGHVNKQGQAAKPDGAPPGMPTVLFRCPERAERTAAA